MLNFSVNTANGKKLESFKNLDNARIFANAIAERNKESYWITACKAADGEFLQTLFYYNFDDNKVTEWRTDYVKTE